VHQISVDFVLSLLRFVPHTKIEIFSLSLVKSEHEKTMNKKIKNNSTLPQEKLLFNANASFQVDFFLLA
jgi:hypothetical protein